MVAAPRSVSEPAPTREPSAPYDGDLLTVWTVAGERITGAYLGYDVEPPTAYLLILEWAGAPPRRVDIREVGRAVRHCRDGKRHVGAE